MTRKTYRQLAEDLGRMLAYHEDQNHALTWQAIHLMCDAMAEDNPRFARQKFLEAVQDHQNLISRRARGDLS